MMQIQIYMKQNSQLLHKRNAEINYGSDRRSTVSISLRTNLTS